jgi:hypothetical protein
MSVITNYEKKVTKMREFDVAREKHPSIELSDIEYMKKMEELKPKLVYRPPSEMEMTPALKEKMAIAIELTKDTKVINLNEKIKSKRSKSAVKKNNSKSNTAAVASIQS